MKYSSIPCICILIFFSLNNCWGKENSQSVPVVTVSQAGIPSDAVVLFDGTNLSEWTKPDGSPAGWDIVNGTLKVVPKTGGIITRRTFGDFQLHIEFVTPDSIVGEGQGRGNSGIYLHGAYEVQVLDSYENETYTDGMLGAVYKQYPPLVNPCRPPGTWQEYDIIFNAPLFDETGVITSRPRLTVFLNGVLVQNNVEILGPTVAAPVVVEKKEGPIFLQDHSNPVTYRSIWIREL